MDKKLVSLIFEFDLESDVREFVHSKVLELEKIREHQFRFSGSPKRCDNDLPHVPHQTGSYNTVRYGYLDYFCAGVSGTDIGEPVVIVTRRRTGSPEEPGLIRGFWYLREVSEE